MTQIAVVFWYMIPLSPAVAFLLRGCALVCIPVWSFLFSNSALFVKDVVEEAEQFTQFLHEVSSHCWQ
jgi:hypothetical protein